MKLEYLLREWARGVSAHARQTSLPFGQQFMRWLRNNGRAFVLPGRLTARSLNDGQQSGNNKRESTP